MTTAQTVQALPAPWWKFGYVWLVIAGPAVVVVAGFITLWLALANPESLVAEDYYRKGIEINKTLAAEKEKSLLPAVQGRNHAATPPGATPAPAGQR
jgi:hypothetical protein